MVKKQALKTTLAELTKIKEDLIKQLQEENEMLKLEDKVYVNYEQQILIPIINKEGLSDTWEFE
jgi:regulator of replication initiation timing